VESVRPGDDEVLQAFRLIDKRADGDTSALLRSFRERLVGELVGDADRVERTLADGFELITYAAGRRTVTPRAAIVDSVRRLGEARGSLLIWVELDDLVIEDGVLATRGVLQTLCTAQVAGSRGQEGVGDTDLCLLSSPIALFLRFVGDKMTEETFYLEASPTRTVFPETTMPSVAQLEQQLAGSPS
jgi:hypothetical protein